MPAYIVLQSTVSDETQYQQQAAWPLMVRFGAKVVARRAQVEILEGEHDQRPISMFEFPDMMAIRAFWDAPEYVPQEAARGHSHPKYLGLSGCLIGSRRTLRWSPTTGGGQAVGPQRLRNDLFSRK